LPVALSSLLMTPLSPKVLSGSLIFWCLLCMMPSPTSSPSHGAQGQIIQKSRIVGLSHHLPKQKKKCFLIINSKYTSLIIADQ
jgi:hypothetical protein